MAVLLLQPAQHVFRITKTHQITTRRCLRTGSAVLTMLCFLCSLVWRTRWSDSKKLWSISQLPPNPARLTWGPPLSFVSRNPVSPRAEHVLLASFHPCVSVSPFSVPGFGPTPFGGPPGHMGPMQPGKNQVDSFSF